MLTWSIFAGPVTYYELLVIMSLQSTPSNGASDDSVGGLAQSPALILQNLFDPSKVSAAKLLYHLEVLSSRLMPVHQRDTNEMTQLFRRNFLEAGGLQCVVNVFKRTSLSQDVDIEVRQACYAIAISLARWVLIRNLKLRLIFA